MAARRNKPEAEQAASKPAQAGAKTGAPADQAVADDLVVEVTGPKKGRWRAGRHFTPEPTVIPLADLSEDDKAALIADPRLSVTTRPANE